MAGALNYGLKLSPGWIQPNVFRILVTVPTVLRDVGAENSSDLDTRDPCDSAAFFSSHNSKGVPVFEPANVGMGGK